ncbi:MAG TPA: hypothetical protein VLA82_07975 [Actinomycetota bacterium]|nr:hypothetical protein [Actinomycetota bacterium]
MHSGSFAQGLARQIDGKLIVAGALGGDDAMVLFRFFRVNVGGLRAPRVVHSTIWVLALEPLHLGSAGSTVAGARG